MAGVSENDSPDIFENSPIFTGMEGDIAHILRKCCSTSTTDIIEELYESIDVEDIKKTKDTLFDQAIDKVNTELRSNGVDIPSDVELVAKKRRNPTLTCTDLVNLTMYVGGLTSTFPKDVLSQKATYIDLLVPKVQVTHGGVACQIVSSQEPSTNPINQDNSINNDVNVKIDAQKMSPLSQTELIEMMQNVLSKNEQLERQVVNIRAHLLSVEKIMFDEIRAVKSIADNNQNAIKSAKSSTTSQSSQRNSAASHESRGATNNNTPGSQDPASQPGETQQTESNEEDPSFTQLMAGLNSQGSTNGQSDDDAESVIVEPEPAAPESTPAQPMDQPTHQPENKDNQSAYLKMDKSTSPRCTRFDQSKVKSSVKKPNVRPSQSQVNDIKSKDTSSNNAKQSDDGFTEVSYGRKSKSKTSHGLQGMKSEPFAELYLANIARRDNQSFSEISEEIKKYCRNKNKRIMSAWIIPNKVADDVVGCRIRVPISSVDDRLGNKIWPDDIMCTKWKNKKQGDYSQNHSESNFRGNGSYNFSGRPRSSSGGRYRSHSRQRSHSRGQSRGNERGRDYSRSSRGSTARSRSGSRQSRRDWFDERR